MEYTDPMGNYTGFAVDPMEEERLRLEEEERRRREERARLEAEKPLVQTVTINPDGTQDVTIKGPASGIQKAVGAMTPKVEPTMAAPGPMSPDDFARYNARIAQQESGARPDIGFHDRTKSTAFGPYGITQGAYQDARRVNPALPADITQASPEQQAQAQTAFTQQNAKYLQSYGVPVNPNTLGAAHFLGAKGLSDYLKSGYISPQAAAANGGEDNVRRIVQGRLGGTMAPASGGVTAPQAPMALPAAAPAAAPTPVAPYDMGEFAGVDQAIAEQARQPQIPYSEAQYQANMESQVRERAANSFITNQDDTRSLAELISNPATPEDIRDAANRRMYELNKQKYDLASTQDKFKNASPVKQSQMLTDKGEQGSILRAWLYSLIGFQSGAQAEVAKMNLPGKWERAVDAQGNAAGMIQYSTNGKPLSGIKTDGTAMDDKELMALGGSAVQKKDIVGGTYVNDTTGEVGRVVSDPRTGVSYVQTDEGRKPMTGFRPQGQGGTIDMQRMRDVQKQNIDLAGDWAKLQMKVAGAGPEAANKFLGEFSEKYKVPVTMQTISGPAPQISLETGRMEMPVGTAPATAAPSRPAAPTTAPAPAGAVVPTATAPVSAPRPAGAVSPAEVAAGVEVGTAETKEYRTKFLPELNTKADQSSEVRTLRKQINTVMDTNPGLIGYLNGTGGTGEEMRNIFRDLVAGTFKSQEDLSARIAKLNFKDDAQGRQAKAAMAEIDNLQRQIAPSTLKAVAGAGAVSEAEQKANRETIGDVTRLPAYTAYSINTRDIFNKDIKIAERDWAQANPQKSDLQHGAAWAIEKKRLQQEYDNIYRARAEYVAKHGSTVEAARSAFKYYPVPEYSPGAGWTYGAYSDKARRNPLSSFNR